MRERIAKLRLFAGFILSLYWMKHMEVDGECFEEQGTLLTRYYLIHRKRSEGRRRFRTYIHDIHRSDAEGVWHDHPWHFISVILWGGYIEHTPTGTRIHRPGAILFRPAHWKHRLELNKRAVTLVFAIGRSREWGFFVGDSQERIAVQHYDYASGRCE